MKHTKAIGIAVCGLAMLAGAAFAKEDFPNEWYGAGGAVDDYALVSRENEPGFSYTPSPEQWRDRNIYQLFTDRFATDGNIRVKSYRPAWDCEYTGDGLNRQYPFNRNYHHGGSWKGLQYQIPYLQGMGVTAVWISGVQQNDQSVTDNRWTPYHQYHVDNFFRCDPAMGTFQDLKDLIDALHAANIAVILDVAPNHMCDKNGWGTKDEDKQFHWDDSGKHWWDNNNKHCVPFDNLDRFHVQGTINNWDQEPENKIGQFKGTDDLKQEDPTTSDILYKAFKNLIDATDCDGFRVDAIKHIPYDWCRNWAQAMRDHAAWRGKKNFLMFGELFSYDTGALASWCADGYGFNSALLFPLMQAMNNAFGYGYSSYQLGEEINRIQQYGAGKENAIAFLDNHDVNRFAMQFGGGDAATAKRIMAPAMTFLYLAPPVPLLYYGTEHMFNQGGHGNGSNRSWDDSNSDDGDWQRECMFDRGFQPGNAQGDMFSDWAKDRGLYYHIAWLNGLRNQSRALRRGGFEQRYSSGAQGLYAFTKWYDDETALVVLNTADDPRGDWIDTGRPNTVFKENGTGDSVTSGADGKIRVDVDGKGSKIYICNFVDNSADVGGSGGGSSSGVWISGTYGFPTENATSDDTIYVNTEAGPTDKISKIEVIYYLNPTVGGDWPASEEGTRIEMSVIPDWNSQAGAWYHAEIPGVTGSGTLHYLIVATTTEDEPVWDSNNGRNYQLTISEPPASIGAKFQTVSANPTEPDDGGTVTITATMKLDEDNDGSDLTVSMDYAFVTRSVTGSTTSEWTTVSSMTKGTATGGVINFTHAISDLPGGKTLIYKLEASDGKNTIRANGGNCYETKITGTITGVTGVCWHCPTNHEPYADVSMRFPVTPKEGWTMYLRVGNYQGSVQGGGDPLDMNGGKLYYRFGAGDTWTAWQSSAMQWERRPDEGENNFWFGTCDIPAGQAGNFLQYYFECDYDNIEELATTYLYMHPDNSGMYLRTTSKAEAEATPFEVGIAAASEGDEPGYIWHGGNITRTANDSVQIWAKIGYKPDNGDAWADEAVIRYRIDVKKEGTARSAGVKAIKSKKARAARSWKALTGEAAMAMNSLVADGAGKGQAMMWMGTITDERLLDDDAVLIYEVYARNTKGTGNWKQAEYNMGDGSCTFEYRMFSDGSGDLTVDGEPADYTTSKFFIDEADSNDTVSVVVEYHAPNDAEAVELFTNFGRRDYADTDWDGDGWPDGMIPPARDSVTAENCADGYWQAIPMTKGTGAFTATLTTGKCGVYRITARYMPAGSTNWVYWADNPNGTDRRDHVVVISPKKAMQQTMYELNVLTTKAAGASNDQSGNFEDLSECLKASTATDPFGEFSIDYLNRMGVNCLWFQPIHPNLDYARGNTDGEGNRYYPGSPYATKNYFSVNYEMTKTKNTAGLTVAQMEANAVAAFTNFVRLCDKAQSDAGGTKKLDTINVMLDGVMNHTSFDAVFGEGIDLALADLSAKARTELTTALGAGWDSVSATNVIPATKLGIQWYSHVVVTNASGQPTIMQDAPATRYVSVDDNDIANAPERYDFGKWNDVAELLYGNYSTMVRYNDMEEKWYEGDDGQWHSYTELGPETSRIYSEEDKYYYDQMLPATKLLWKYMASYPEYWIKKTGNDGVNHPGATDANGVLTDDYGIDGLRCDYAQGLPNQFWEYTINRTRAMKWNFLFMAESLDGGKVGFRSNRQFDILNENMVFRFTQDHISDPVSFQTELENRRKSYGNGLILLNETCHDEIIPWGDPQVTASRYAMVSAIDGVPMIFYGQEQAISTFVLGGWGDDGQWYGDDPEAANKWKGFLKFESNFGKWIPHFKKWNKMLVWDEMVYSNGTANASRDIAAFYGRINLARQKSPALQSQNRWFLNDTNKVMFVAKWEEEGANPNDKDAVFAAVLFLNDNEEGDHNGHWGAGCTYDISPFAAKMGILNRADKFYNLKNIASTSDEFVWAEPKSGKQLYSEGLELIFQGSWRWNEQQQKREDLLASEWTDNGNVVQYLKVYDVTGEVPPVAPDGLTINDPSETIEVANATATYDIVGMAGDDVVGAITWTNAAVGVGGTFTKATVWTQEVALAVGTNVITVTAQSSGSSTATVAEDTSTNPAYTEGASYDGLNGGTGFGAWSVTFDADNGGCWANGTGFGMWVNENHNTAVRRTLPRALKKGDVFSIDFINSDVATGGGCGFGLCSASDDDAGFRIWYNGGSEGDANHYGTTAGNTTFGWTDKGLHIEVTMTSDTAYTAVVSVIGSTDSTTLSGSFTAACDRFRVWNWNNHNDLYVNNPKLVETTSSPSGTVSATATIVRAESAKAAPTIKVEDNPSTAEVGETVVVSVTASGEGNPELKVASATVDGKAYSGYTYSAGTGKLVFTPQTAGEYKFDFLATNTSADGNTATTNVVVTVTDNAPTIEVTTVAKVEIVDGKVKITLSTSSEGALSGVPVWGATGFDPSTGDWGWLPDPIGYANIDADGNTTLDLTITSESLIISVGKPSYLD